MPFSESPGDLQRMLNTLCNNSIERKLKVNKFIALELWKFDLLWYYGKNYGTMGKKNWYFGNKKPMDHIAHP